MRGIYFLPPPSVPAACWSEQGPDAHQRGTAVPLPGVAGPRRAHVRHGTPLLPQACVPLPPAQEGPHGGALQVCNYRDMYRVVVYLLLRVVCNGHVDLEVMHVLHVFRSAYCV